MPTPSLIKATHKSIAAHYATLRDLAAQNVSHEMATRRAFQELLGDTAKLHEWPLITEESHAGSNAGILPASFNRNAGVRPGSATRTVGTTSAWPRADHLP